MSRLRAFLCYIPNLLIFFGLQTSRCDQSLSMICKTQGMMIIGRARCNTLEIFSSFQTVFGMSIPPLEVV